MEAEGAACDVQESTTCCFAVQDKVWVTGPEIPWEIYTVLADATVMHGDNDPSGVHDNVLEVATATGGSCC